MKKLLRYPFMFIALMAATRAFPADDMRIERLFKEMGDRLLAIYDAETKTLAALREAVED